MFFMKKLLIASLLIIVPALYSSAEDKTFIREYYYQAGESDSKISSRNRALTEVKSLLLEEIGVYLESYINYSIEQTDDRITSKFLQKEIEQISAGITETTILEENWTGIEYYVKAEITVDPDDVIRQLNNTIEKRKASVVVDSLNMLLTEANTSIKAKESEIASLRDSLEYGQEALARQEKILHDLNKELSRLKSRHTQYEQQEKAVQTEIDRIKSTFSQKTSKASKVLIGMNAENVLSLCGDPLSSQMIIIPSKSVNDIWNYGDITIMFDNTSVKTQGGLVIKGVRTSEMNRYGIEHCRNILGTLYSD